MLLVGAANPLFLSAEERQHQDLRTVSLPDSGEEGQRA